jgi:predicted RNase H-like HicB family nuclease
VAGDYLSGMSEKRSFVLVLQLELEREEDGRWIGAVPSLPGILAYGASQDEAARKAVALALGVLGGELAEERPFPAWTTYLVQG